MAELAELLRTSGGSPFLSPGMGEALRGKTAYGNILQATGDRALAPLGGNLTQQADSQGRLRATMAQAAQRSMDTNRWREAQQDMSRRKLALERTLGDRNYELAKRELELAEQQALIPEAPDYDTLPKGLRNDIQETTQMYSSIKALRNYAEQAEKDPTKTFNNPQVAGIEVPGGRGFLNFLARNAGGALDAMAGPESSQVLQFWQNYTRNYETIARKQFYGATLTPQEKAAWDRANAGEGMSEETLKLTLSAMEKAMDARRSQLRQGLELENYNPEALDYYFDEMDMTMPGIDSYLGGVEDYSPRQPTGQGGGQPRQRSWLDQEVQPGQDRVIEFTVDDINAIRQER